MIQYKTIAGPVGLTINRNDDYASAVRQYASIIDREAVGGWKFECIRKVPVTKKAGCLARLFGRKDITLYMNMLVFSKDDSADISSGTANNVNLSRLASQADTRATTEETIGGTGNPQNTASDYEAHIPGGISQGVSGGADELHQPNNKKRFAFVGGAVALVLIICLIIGNSNSKNDYYEPNYDNYTYSDYDYSDDYDDYDDYDDVVDKEAVPYNRQQIYVRSYGQTATLTLSEYQNGGWVELMSIEAYIGKNGIAYDKREGDRCTPAGTFTILYYINTEPLNTDLKYIEIDNDDVWICDPQSRYYNTMQDRDLSSADWNSALNENLYRKFEGGYSVACIMFDYNGDGLNAGEAYMNKGSDIFIDGVGPEGNITSGYGDIKISASDMYKLLGYLDSSKNPILIVE